MKLSNDHANVMPGTGSSSERKYKRNRHAQLQRRVAALTALIMAHGLASSGRAGDTNAPTVLPDVIVRGRQGLSDGYKPERVESPKYTEPVRDTPQTIAVIPQTVIQDQGATTLRDVLRNVPGISMQAGEGGGGLPGDNLSIRGFNARNDIYIDGVRDYGAYSRDPFNIEQVEVSKGPASTYTGRGSTGGSVNLVSKTPHEEPSYDGTLGLGTDEYKRTTVDLNQPFAPSLHAATRLNVLWHDADQPGRDVVRNSRWAVAPSVAVGVGQPTRATLSYLHMKQNNIPDYGIPWVPVGNTNAVLSRYINKAPPVDFENFYGIDGYDFEHVTTDIGTLVVDHEFNDSLRLRNLSRLAQTHRNSAITAPRFADLDPGPATVSDTIINRQLQRREMTNLQLANQTDLTWEFETGPVGHTLVSGVELSREDQDNKNSAQTTNQPQTDIFDPHPNDDPLGPMPAITGVPNTARADTLALYAFDTMKFGERWQLIGGTRWDHVEADYRSGALDLEHTDDLVSWRGAVVFKPRENGSVYFGAGTSFNPSIDGNTGLALATNNVALRPEKTFSLELGTKWELFKDRLLATLALFRTEKTNARTAGINPGDPPLVLDGVQVVDGVEIGFTGNITKDWQVIAGYAFMHTEIEASNTVGEQGNELSNAPEHSASLWTTYRLPWNLEVGVGAQYVGDRKNGTTTNIRTAPDYCVFDALVAYRVNEHMTLRLNVYNLADEQYIDRVGGGHFVPGAGRSAVLSSTFEF